ncbi:hypothetical protein NQ317_011317 [Molorchus minor]|uniref:Lipase domain-containing protein n=1 Tax=Molorchus minor TaxID=1323400 RepID=A0ABQ9IZ23_9CUCU|nr:hypothetical protein NQ317_011317 [Molorchus minor]
MHIIADEAFSALKKYFDPTPAVDITLADAEKGDVIFTSFKNAADVGKVFTDDGDEDFDITLPTVVMIHGLSASKNLPWYKSLKDGYFKLGPHNVIGVDWTKLSNKYYKIANANTFPAAKMVTEFLIASRLPPENIHIIGFSAGAHIAGMIGKNIFEFSGKKIGRISGLDPGSPCYETPLLGENFKLCKTDADFVDVLHTNTERYGYTAPLGHVDFYANGGGVQPGCPTTGETGQHICSHNKAVDYFVESISKKSMSKEATFGLVNSKLIVKIIDSPREIVYGQHIDKNIRGIFYLKTNPEEPFLG